MITHPPTSAEPKNPSAARFTSVHLLIALALLFFASPFIQELPSARVIQRFLIAVVFLSALFAVSDRSSLLAGSLLAAAALIGQWVGFFIPAVAPYSLLPAIAFLFFVIARVLDYILVATRVDNETLCACLSGFLMIGLLWATGFTLLGHLDPKAFAFTLPGQTMDGFESFYFSFVTLSTIGYGDITPVSRVAKMLCIMEAVTGMFYVAVLVARLVSIYSSPARKNSDDKPD
ncbi:MAG: potassium channel family protein [Verrucomicrobiota bacterium]